MGFLHAANLMILCHFIMEIMAGKFYFHVIVPQGGESAGSATDEHHW